MTTTNVLLTVVFLPLVAVSVPSLVNPNLVRKFHATNLMVVYIPPESALTITLVLPTLATQVLILASSNPLNVMTPTLAPSTPAVMDYANLSK